MKHESTTIAIIVLALFLASNTPSMQIERRRHYSANYRTQSPVTVIPSQLITSRRLIVSQPTAHNPCDYRYTMVDDPIYTFGKLTYTDFQPCLKRSMEVCVSSINTSDRNPNPPCFPICPQAEKCGGCSLCLPKPSQFVSDVQYRQHRSISRGSFHTSLVTASAPLPPFYI